VSPRVALLGLALFAVACDDPAKGKTKAVTGEAASSTAAPLSAEAKSASGAVRYDFDNESSKVEWTGSKVSAKHEGGFKSFRGNIAVPDGNSEKGSVNVEIDTDSLFTTPEKLVGHLKSGDFFDVGKFPKATFNSTEVKKGGEKGHTVTGNLNLHGVTKSISFPASIKTSPTSADVDAEFAINRKDFGLVYAGAADDLIRDDVVIKLSIRAPKKG
jgi:polyisoprenoid-binding protein YceI